MQHYIFGVDIGGTTVKLGLFSDRGELLEKWEIPTRTMGGGEQILPDVAAAIEEKMAQRGMDAAQVEGIGIGVPGPVGEDATVYHCVNLGWGIFNVREQMNRLLPGIPNVAVGNDANVATLGELWQGGGKGHESVVMFTLGTGVGGGIVLGGRILTGVHGAAGEVGHIMVEPEETEPCNCGKRGCLEQYASATGIVRLAGRMLRESVKLSGLRSIEKYTAKDVCDLARDGDELAMEILDRGCSYLGRAMSHVACAVDPGAIIIGGGVSRAGNVLTDAVKKHYRASAFHASAGTAIVTAQLGNEAGIYGCAKMILN